MNKNYNKERREKYTHVEIERNIKERIAALAAKRSMKQGELLNKILLQVVEKLERADSLKEQAN